jgi:hypothetical protein
MPQQGRYRLRAFQLDVVTGVFDDYEPRASDSLRDLSRHLYRGGRILPATHHQRWALDAPEMFETG